MQCHLTPRRLISFPSVPDSDLPVFATSDPEVQFGAVLGDAKHKQDVIIAFGSFGPEVNPYLSNAHQARWLKAVYPKLVPPKNPNGTPPNDHTVATAFEYYYEIYPALQVQYRRYITFRANPQTADLVRELD